MAISSTGDWVCCKNALTYKDFFPYIACTQKQILIKYTIDVWQKIEGAKFMLNPICSNFRYFFITSILILAICCVLPIQATAADQTVAMVNGQPIKASELEAHIAATQFGREQALEDLIDLQLVRSAVAANKVKAPSGTWSAEVRTEVEYALAKVLSLDIPPPQISLIVDHAWLKDASTEKDRAAGHALLVQLRNQVKAGATIPDAYNKLQVDGSNWHIGDHEEYPYNILAAEARDLPPGTLSEIIPGDGGEHLFKIHEKKEQIPSSSEFRYILSDHLRKDSKIDIIDLPTE